MDYWGECIKEAFEDAGIEATDEQINTVTSWVSGAHENYGLATGEEFIPNPLHDEVRRLENKLKEKEDDQQREYEKFKREKRDIVYNWRSYCSELEEKIRELRNER